MRSNERQVIVPILEGEEQDPALCTRIGEVIVSDLPPDRPTAQPVQVTMRYNEQGILEVTAFDVRSGRTATADISRNTDAADQAAWAAATEAVRKAHIE
jgi:molecular chaperone DnaK (HSP70)